MAYDPKDPADKKIVDGLIATALAEQAEEHEADVQGLKDNKRELLRKLADAKAGNGGSDNSAEVERLETDLRAANKALKAAERARDEAVTERDEAVADRDKEKVASTKLFTANALTSAIAGVKVKEGLLPAVEALLEKKGIEIKEVGGERKAFVNGKPLGEFVTEWSQGDEGKHYVTAPLNGGGGGGKPQVPGSSPSGGVKSSLSEMSLAERTALAKEDPQKFNSLLNAQKAEEKSNRRGLV